MTNKKGQIYQRNVRHAYIFLRRHFGSRSTRSGTFIFKMAEMLQIPRVFPLVSCLGSAKAVQWPRPEPKLGDKSQQISRYSPVCPRGHPPGMAAHKCIIMVQIQGFIWNKQGPVAPKRTWEPLIFISKLSSHNYLFEKRAGNYKLSIGKV